MKDKIRLYTLENKVRSYEFNIEASCLQEAILFTGWEESEVEVIKISETLETKKARLRDAHN